MMVSIRVTIKDIDYEQFRGKTIEEISKDIDEGKIKINIT